MYNKVTTDMNFCSREKEVLDFWKQNEVFKKSLKENENSKDYFTFYDGPPTANGKPHIGHILTRVIKDIIPRYKTMKGYNVLRKAGWDTHGLPVELEVEKLLGIDGKQEIEKYGIEPFIQKCKESVWKYKGEWEQMSDRVGFWADMENPYITYDNNYIESVWWALKTIYDKGLIYKGYKIVPYCPRCGTALSSHEVAQGYKDVKETSVIVKFKATDEENTYYLAWTTTPWTLPSNICLIMNPNENYVKVKVEDTYYIVAEALASTVFENYEVIYTKKGVDFERRKYEPLFDYADEKTASNGYYLTVADYVTLTDGTGIVHCAPAFGEDDAQVGRRYNLPFVQYVDERGRFTDEVYDMKGIFVKDGDRMVIDKLYEKGLMFKEVEFTHSYPYCWRCDTPLLYYARSSWFIKMSALREKLLKNNSSVNWIPPTIGTGRMGNFLDNVIDWGFSRERYWGTPLPIWVCPDCGEIKVVGSRKELRELAGLSGDVELHRPYIDQVTFKCDKCGGEMKRTPEVLDCWFDSGSMPFAQFHYPFENKEEFEKRFPAQFISEAVDQTRGWFYTLLAVSTLLFDKSPFENCIVLGHVNDKDGIKMSKHKGNVVDPWSVLDVQGADAVRWYFYTASMPWLPSRFSAENVSECQRKFMGTLWNTYAFYVLYAEIDKFDPSKYSLKDCKFSMMDKWILSGLNSLVKFVNENLENYKITECARKIQDFVDELSNWYVRRSRDRYWGKDMSEDKISAYMTLYTVLVTLSKLLAPFTPFMAESIYQNLVANFFKDEPISVHLCKYPEADLSLIDEKLEEDMEYILEVVNLARASRNSANIKNRQPLKTMFIKTDDAKDDKEVLSIIAEEINVKEVVNVEDDTMFIDYELKPQLKTLGPKYGKLINSIREYLATCDTLKVVNTVKAGETFTCEIDGKQVDLELNDLLISVKNKEGFVATQNGNFTVILDTNLTEELVNEGIAREIVSKVQTMRKDAGLEVIDHIVLGYKASGKVAEIIASDESIRQDVLADKVVSELDGFTKEWNINDNEVVLSVKKA